MYWVVEDVDCCCLRELPEAEPVELMLSGVPGLSEPIPNDDMTFSSTAF